MLMNNTYISCVGLLIVELYFTSLGAFPYTK